MDFLEYSEALKEDRGDLVCIFTSIIYFFIIDLIHSKKKKKIDFGSIEIGQYTDYI